MSNKNPTPLTSYQEEYEYVQAHIRSMCEPLPITPENISRDRLLRVQKGLLYLLTNVIPCAKQSELRGECLKWIDALHDIASFEKCDADGESKVQEAKA